MKTILMLTDFSENANHAAKTAAGIAAQLNVGVLLYNTYYDHPILPTYAGGPWVVEELMFRKKESSEQLDQLARQLRPIIADFAKGEYEPEIVYQCGEGSLGKNVAAIIAEKEVGLIVIGSSSDGSLDHFIFGSDTVDVIEHATCPVLIIPPKSAMNELKTVTLAITFELSDINAISCLTGLSKQLNFELQIVHVATPDKKVDAVAKSALLHHIEAMKAECVTYREIRGKQAAGRLQQFCKDNSSAILALVHHRSGFFSGLLNNSTTTKALKNQRMPLMVIPAGIIKN